MFSKLCLLLPCEGHGACGTVVTWESTQSYFALISVKTFKPDHSCVAKRELYLHTHKAEQIRKFRIFFFKLTIIFILLKHTF